MRQRRSSTEHSVLEPRDGPTEEFREHIDVTDRVAGGKKVFSKLEQLLISRQIEPEQSEAGRRFARDYLKGNVGRTSCSLNASTGGRGSDGMTDVRLDACRRLDEAVKALEVARPSRMKRGRAGELLIELCVNNTSYVQLARSFMVSKELVKDWIFELLAVLAAHYERIDEANGRSSTAHTYQAALKRFEPEIP